MCWVGNIGLCHDLLVLTSSIFTMLRVGVLDCWFQMNGGLPDGLRPVFGEDGCKASDKGMT
jgi:hypothetical protein